MAGMMIQIEWRKTTGCLPERGESVLIKTGDGDVYMARRIHSSTLGEDCFSVKAAPFKDGGIINFDKVIGWSGGVS